MKILIVGCGKVGQTLAAELNEEGNDITMIDLDAHAMEDISTRLDIMGVVGNGATHTVLEEAGIDKADLLIAVTGSDELNLLCCIIARRASSCRVIARVRNPVYSTEATYLKDELGLAMVINPEQAAAAEIARVLRFPSAIKIDTFAKGRAELLTFRLSEGSMLVGMSVKDVMIKLGCDILFCTVERGKDVYIAKGDFVFAEKDIISVVASPENLTEFFKKINYKTRSSKNVLVVGGGEMTHYLCGVLKNTHMNVSVIEPDEAKCGLLADEFPSVTVFCGDPSDREFLLEKGADRVDAFVALTRFDEENILLSLFAKGMGECKTVTKVNRIDFDDVIKHLDLDTTIYPENITADIIVRYVRSMKSTMGSNMETLYQLIKGKVEAAEFIVRENSPVINIPLMEMKLKADVLVAAIIRDGKVRIPRGQDVILPGDGVIIVSKLHAMHDVSDILR